MYSTSPARIAKGLPSASQTWSNGWTTGAHPQKSSSVPVLPRGCNPRPPQAVDMRQTWSDSQPREGHPMARRQASKGSDTMATLPAMDGLHQTWSTGFLPRHGQHTLGSSGKWPPRSVSKSCKQGFSGFGLPVWDHLLQVLSLQDAGPLAAVSRDCHSQLLPDLTAAAKVLRTCRSCGVSFNYAAGTEDCWYHPGKEMVQVVGDNPVAGMMDVSWSCCGRGACYTVGIALACTQSEIQGCCARRHCADISKLTVRESLEGKPGAGSREICSICT